MKLRGTLFFLFVMSVSYLVRGDIQYSYQPGHVDALQHLKKIKKEFSNFHVESVTFAAQESSASSTRLTRKGVLLTRDNAVANVILCHGYQASKHEALFFENLFPQCNALAFDFRAHGELAQDQHCTLGRDEAFDVLAAAQFIKNHPELQDKPLFVYGFSMGAVAAIQAQAQQAVFDAMILDCPYDCTDDILMRGLSTIRWKILGKEFGLPGKRLFQKYVYSSALRPVIRLLFKWVVRFDPYKVNTHFVRVSPKDSVTKITVPALFIHCENDKKIPVQAIQKVYEAKPGYRRLWVTKGRKHFDSYMTQPKKYWYKVNKFVSKFLHNSLRGPEQKISDDRTILQGAV